MDSRPAARRTRTRTGCLNCRRRKRKCDESRPECGTCRKRGERCQWGLKLTFRAENAHGIDGTHPSMKRTPRRSRPGEYEIRDVTAEVVRDYNNSPGGPGEECETPECVVATDISAADATSKPSTDHRCREYGLSKHTFGASPAESLSSQRQTEDAVADLLFLSQGGRPQAADIPALTVPMGPLDVMADYSYAHAFAPESTAHDSIYDSVYDSVFLPGSAYHELHSTLRTRLIQEVTSSASTRVPTPGPEAGGQEDVFPVHSGLGDGSLPDDCELWRNWVDEIAPWLDKFDRDRHFQMTIPTMARDHAHLRHAVLALSARQIELKEAHREKTMKEKTPADRSLVLYQSAIHELLPLLPTRSTAVIATCVVLCVLEMLSCSPKAWRRHLDGCASLMEAVGMNGRVGGVEQALFWCFARMDVCGGLISSVKTLIPVSRWMPLPETTSPDVAESDDIPLLFLRSAVGCFEQYANYAVYLIASALDLLAPVESAGPSCRDDPPFRDRWLRLWGYMCDWYRRRPAELLPIVTMPSSATSPFPTVLYSNPAAISGNQLHHTASILMLQGRPPSVRLSGAADRQTRSVLWHARQVCGISITNHHHGAWTNGIQPLWIAGRCMSHPSEHKAILELLERIERESGWKTRWRAEDLVEFWGDLGE